MRKKRLLTGINIQYPISVLVVQGKKTIETRTYPIPQKFIGREMVIIETPGTIGKFKARIIGLITFGESFKYTSKEAFYKDQRNHCVSPTSPWGWTGKTEKWGWPILQIDRFTHPLPAPAKKGIKYTSNIRI